MPTDELSYIGKCDIEVRPLYPVRFGLSYEALKKLQSGKEISKTPNHFQTNEDYDLRRLRRGYLYILFITKQHKTEEKTKPTDGKKHWYVFRYHTLTGDANSDDEQIDRMQFHFSKLHWSNGKASGDWLPDSRSYPYAFVPKNVSHIYYAYSENRWPEALFNKMLSDEEARDKIMHHANLNDEKDTNYFPFSEGEKYVDDFKKTEKNLDEHNSLIHTAVGYSKEKQVKIACPIQQKMAKIITLHDPVGNVADVAQFYNTLNLNDVADKLKYKYPITIAKALHAIGRMELQKDNKANSGTHPIDKLIDAGYDLLKKEGKHRRYRIGVYVEKEKALRAQQRQYIEVEKIKEYGGDNLAGRLVSIHNLLNAHDDLLNETGAYTLQAQIEVCTALHIEKPDDLAINQAIHEYYSGLWSSAINEMTAIPQGVEQLAKRLSDPKDFYTKALKDSIIFARALVGTANSAIESNLHKEMKVTITAVSGLKREAYITTGRKQFDIMMSQALSSVYRTWLSKSQPPFGLKMANILDAYALKTRQITGNYGELKSAIGAMFRDLSDIPVPDNYQLNRPRKIPKNTVNHTPMLNKSRLADPVTSAKRTALITHQPTLEYQIIEISPPIESSNLEANTRNMHINTHLCVGSLLLNILSVNKANLKRDVDGVWKGIKHPAFELAADGFSLVDAWKAKPVDANALKAGAEKAVSPLLKASKAEFLSQFNISSGAKPIPTLAQKQIFGTGARLKNLATAGRLAGVMGVALGALQVRQGYANEDDNEKLAGVFTTTGAVLGLIHGMMVEEILLLGAGFATPIGWIALGCVALGIIFSFCADSDLQTWVKFSFWGDSKEYWGEERTSRKFLDRLDESTKWSNKPSGHKTIREYFKQEIESYYDYTWDIIIENSIKGDKQISLFSPLFAEASSCEKLQIQWLFNNGQQNPQHTYPLSKSTTADSDIGAAKIIKTWICAGQIDLDFSHAMPTQLFKETYNSRSKTASGAGICYGNALNAGLSTGQHPACARLSISYPKFQGKGTFTAKKTFYSETEI